MFQSDSTNKACHPYLKSIKIPKLMGKHLDFPGAARRYFHNSNLSIKMILLQHESISRKGNHQSFNEPLGDSWRSSSIVRILQVEMERGKLLGTQWNFLSRFGLIGTVLWSISKFGASPCLRLDRILSHGICTALGTGEARKKRFRGGCPVWKLFPFRVKSWGIWSRVFRSLDLGWSSRHKSWISNVFFHKEHPIGLYSFTICSRIMPWHR